MEKEVNKQVEKLINLLKWPFILVLIFEIAALFLDNSEILIWLANLCFLGYAVYLMNKDRSNSLAVVAWTGGVTIFLLSFTVSTVELILNFKFWYLFNLITEPLIYACVGAGLSSFMYLINKKYFMKGGELNGGKESSSST